MDSRRDDVTVGWVLLRVLSITLYTSDILSSALSFISYYTITKTLHLTLENHFSVLSAILQWLKRLKHNE